MDDKKRSVCLKDKQTKKNNQIYKNIYCHILKKALTDARGPSADSQMIKQQFLRKANR